MKPYYEHAGITIFHGDCRELLATVTGDVLVTDPPYGINYRTSSSRVGWGTAHDWPAVEGDNEPFDPSHLPLCLPACLWGANHYADRLPSSSQWLVWYTRRPGVANDSADCELAWTSLDGPARVFAHEWMGLMRDSERGEAYHPTQKPVALMQWVLGMMPEGVVLDPYMGSGSTLLAAKAMGRRAIGIEINESYCATAVRRLAQEVLQFGVAP
jgi:site-specific DNA-methyltransferase (adenine-specific)